MADLIQAYYFIGTMSGAYTKVYDGKKLEADVMTYDGYLNTDQYVTSITDEDIAHVNQYGTMKYDETMGKNVGTLNLFYDDGYPKVFRNGVDVTDLYNQTQVTDYDFSTKTLGHMTFTIISRDITLKSGSGTWEYDGKAHSAETVSDETGGQEDMGYVSGEEFTYSNFATVTFVTDTPVDNSFECADSSTALTSDYNVTRQYGQLTITQRTSPLIITVINQERDYDGTATIQAAAENVTYTVMGDLAYNDTLTVTLINSNINAGTYTDGITADYMIIHDNGDGTYADVTSMYANVTVDAGDLTVNKRNVTITSSDATKAYDGTPLTCHTYTVQEGATEEYQLLNGEEVVGVGFTADSTITHAGSTANKIDATNVTINKADGSDSSMNYNILTEDGELTVTARGVLLWSTSAEKFYDGTALQNRQVVITGFEYDENGNVVVDEDGGFLAGDGCTYDFVGDNIVIDGDGNIIQWTVSEQSYTAYGQTDVGTSKNEFNYNNFTSVYAGSYEDDYIIMYGFNQDALGLSKEDWDLFGDLTVWGGPVEINMTDYSWTYDYQAKTNGYFDDGYTVKVTTNEEGFEKEETTVAHNSEGYAIALLGNDTIVVTVTPEDGRVETGKVQHVGDNTQNEASYAIYRDGVDVTEEVEEYYQISIDGGNLSITPRTVYITSGSATKDYTGEALTDNTVFEGEKGRDTGFIFGEGAAYEVTGSQTEVGASSNTFAISELLTDTHATDYNFVMNEGTLLVKGEGTQVVSTTAINCKDNGYGCVFQVLANGQGLLRSAMTSEVVEGTLENVGNWKIVDTGDFDGNGTDGLLWQDMTTGELVVQNNMTSFAEVNNKTTVLGWVEAGYTALASGDFTACGQDGALLQTPAFGNAKVSTNYGLATYSTDSNGEQFVGWLGALVNTWDEGDALKGDLSDPASINANNYRYEVLAVGDFNGDGRDDVMLQNKMPTTVDGHEITGSGDVFTFLTGSESAIKAGEDPTVVYAGRATDGWEVLGTGDFDSDGDADVLLGKVNVDGTTTLAGWSMKNGQQQDAFALGTMSEYQEFKGIADYNADGTDDLLVSTATSTGDELSAWTIKNATVTGSLAIV